MSFRKRQRGISFLGLVALVAILGFASVIGLKLIPIYMDSWKIDKVIDAVISDPDVNRQTSKEVRDSVLKRLDLDSVEAVNYTNHKQTLTVIRQKNNTRIDVFYRVETPLIGNLYLIAEFDKSVST